MIRGKALCTRDVEFRAKTASEPDEQSDGRTLDGYAAVFDQDTEINSIEGRFIERMSKGAFRKTLRENKGRIQMQWDHGMDFRVGTVPIGSYDTLEEDDHGLHVVGRIFDNDVAEPIRQAIEAGAVQGMSFKFRVVRDEWRDAKGKLIKPDELLDLLWGQQGERGPIRRTVKEVQLMEAGPVSTPAYGGTSVGVRGDEGGPELTREELVESYRSSMFVEEPRSEEEDERKKKPPFPPKDPDDDDEDPPKEKDPKQDDDDDDDPPKGKEPKEDDDDDVDPDDEDDPKKKKSGKSETKSANLDDAARRSTLARLDFRYDAARTGTSTPVSKEQTTTPRKVESPMTLEELRARAAELRAELISLDEESRGAALSDEAQEKWNTGEAELRTVEESIKAIEARQERLKGFAQDTSRTEKSTPGAPAFHRDRDVFDLDAIRSESTSADNFVERVKENAERAVDKMRFSRVTSKESAQERMSNLLDYCDDDNGTLAKRILLTGSPLYERAFSKAMKACSVQGLTGDEARAMSMTAANGGYAVPVQLDPSVILTNDGFVGDLRSISRVETIVGKKWQGVTTSGITVQRDSGLSGGSRDAGVGRVSEAEEATDNSFTLGQPEVEAVRVQGFVPFSIEIDQDWGGLRTEITRLLADAKSREELESFTLGDGTGTPAEPKGFVEFGTAHASAGEAFTDADVYSLELALAPRWRRNGRFMANKATYQAVRQFAAADGHDLWERIGNGMPSRLLGYEALENSYMDDSVADIDDAVTAVHKLMVFGDFQQFLIVDRVGMDVEFVPHIFGSNGRPTGQRGIYAIWRNNAAVLVPTAFQVLTVTTAA